MDNRMLKFTIASLLLIAAGAATLVMAVVVFRNRLHGIDTSLLLAILTALIMLLYSLLNIYIGIQGIRLSRRRSRTSKLARLAIFSVIGCILGLTLSAINGIIVSHLIIIVITGIVIPMIFIFIGMPRN